MEDKRTKKTLLRIVAELEKELANIRDSKKEDECMYQNAIKALNAERRTSVSLQRQCNELGTTEENLKSRLDAVIALLNAKNDENMSLVSRVRKLTEETRAFLVRENDLIKHISEVHEIRSRLRMFRSVVKRIALGSEPDENLDDTAIVSRLYRMATKNHEKG